MFCAPKLEPALFAILIQFETNNKCQVLFLFYFSYTRKFFNYNKYEIRCGLAGFDVVGKACCSTGKFELSYLCNELSPFTCSDANKYVFWDAFHPTEKTNHIIVNSFLDKLLAYFRWLLSSKNNMMDFFIYLFGFRFCPYSVI